MNKAPESKNAEWTKPELVRLGKIADVAGPSVGVTQNANKS